MNCAILDDSFYIEEISNLLPKWVTEGQKELSDDRSVWEWTKFNIRSHAIQFSKKEPEAERIRKLT